MAGAAAEVAEVRERREVKGGDDLGGGEKAKAVHALLEGSQRSRSTEEVAEDVGGGIDLEGLGPPMGAFATASGRLAQRCQRTSRE